MRSRQAEALRKQREIATQRSQLEEDRQRERSDKLGRPHSTQFLSRRALRHLNFLGRLNDEKELSKELERKEEGCIATLRGFTTPAMSATLRETPTEVDKIAEAEKPLVFRTFTAETAWELGNALRSRLLDFPAAAVINISLANNNQLLFHAVTRSGTQPDNDLWVARKRNTVLRWGKSTWHMRAAALEAWRQSDSKEMETLFAEKYALGDTANQYAIHGGGFPVRVSGVEGVVGVIVVSGLKQEWDHQIIIDTVESYLKNQGAL
jgi:uncharacterized protein (UPF0303 family)